MKFKKIEMLLIPVYILLKNDSTLAGVEQLLADFRLEFKAKGETKS
jgi:hypothetical protein